MVDSTHSPNEESRPTLETEMSPADESTATPLFERAIVLFGVFLLVGTVLLVGAYLTVHKRPLQEFHDNPGARRANVVFSRWLNDGYFHYFGMLVHTPKETTIYTTWTGAYMVSSFIVERLYYAFTGRYSWRLAALHNVIVSLLLAALSGLLAFRVARRIGVDTRLAIATGSAIMMLVFTFPDNLGLYWELSAQAPWAIFAVAFLLIEERCLDGRRTASRTAFQVGAAFLMAMMEGAAALAFVGALSVTTFVLEQRRGNWKRFALITVLPVLAACAVYGCQRKAISMRFPDTPTSGSSLIFRSGLDGESLYYGDHLDIANRRDLARRNWRANREYLFRWTWVFILGTASSVAVLAAYLAGRMHRFALEVLATLIGTWVIYAAVFSQAVVIHPYLYDLLLFIPLVMALFAFAPALMESLTRRSGAIILIVVFCACWYTFFQMRLYALRYPMPGTRVARTTT